MKLKLGTSSAASLQNSSGNQQRNRETGSQTKDKMMEIAVELISQQDRRRRADRCTG